jgi:GT2 family glycosyltransferase
MSDNTSLSISIVTYKTDPVVLDKVLSSIVNSTQPADIYIIDNSPNELLKSISNSYGAYYFYPGRNLGFGRGHNLALKKVKEGSRYHLILNADISFDSTVLAELCAFMDLNPSVGWVMPNVLYPDNSRQELCKRLPTPWDLFYRRFLGGSSAHAGSRNKFKCHDIDLSIPRLIPNLSGCFALLRTDIFRSIGGFDERFFLYLEDTDLVRRAGEVSLTVFYPYAHVYHVRGRGSYQNFRLLTYHISSAFRYFSKWGWFFDKRRSQINQTLDSQGLDFITPQNLITKQPQAI